MAETSIEWADYTFNPWLGCEKVSPGCKHCYAEAWAKQRGRPTLWRGDRSVTRPDYWKQLGKWNWKAALAGQYARVFCGARPMDPAWPRKLRDDCAAAGADFFMKQWGQHNSDLVRLKSKHDAGRLLDGVLHDAIPAAFKGVPPHAS
jgi:protein gp37